jgi:hypothetical protein
LYCTLYYPCFYVFWSCDEQDEDRFSFCYYKLKLRIILRTTVEKMNIRTSRNE